MKLVVAGLGRTGTQSLVAALRQLGLRTLSQEELFADTDLLARVIAMVQGEAPYDPSILDGVDATVGWPMCWLFEAQLAHHPEAVCLLNTRDADAWFDSVGRVVPFLMPLLRLPINRRLRLLRVMFGILTDKMGGAPERETWTAGYRAHAAHVRAAVPLERLVEYPIGAGWEPLCSALGVPVPEAPFPSTNSSKDGDFRERFRKVLGLKR